MTPGTMEKLTRYENLFSFTIDGICEHLEADQPDAERIESALIYLKEEFYKIMDQTRQEG